MMTNQTHNNTGGGGGGGGMGGGGGGGGMGGGGVGNGSVIMLYGLPANRFNCDHLFNLVCSYGNVLKVCYSIKYLCNVISYHNYVYR